MYDILPTKRSVNLPTTNQRGFQRCWWCFSISRYFCLLCDAAEVFVVRQSIYRHLQTCLSFSLQNGSTFSCYIVTGHLPLLFDLGFQRWFNLKLSPSHKWLDKELAQEFNKKITLKISQLMLRFNKTRSNCNCPHFWREQKDRDSLRRVGMIHLVKLLTVETQHRFRSGRKSRLRWTSRQLEAQEAQWQRRACEGWSLGSSETSSRTALKRDWFTEEPHTEEKKTSATQASQPQYTIPIPSVSNQIMTKLIPGH